MIIENVKMENFLSHRNSDIYLGTGINIILGQNGSGKSSIFEAIKVAFFGQGESERKRVVSYNSTMASIQVRFRIGSHEYEVSRQIENKKDREMTRNATLHMDGQKLAEGAGAVSAEIQNIMGISKSAFINSIYVDQGQIDSLVKETPAERKDVFNEIIGLKNYDRAFNEVDRIVKDMSAKIGQFEFITDGLRNSEEEIGRKREELEKVERDEKKNDQDMKQTDALMKEINGRHLKFVELNGTLKSQTDYMLSAVRERNDVEKVIREVGDSLKNLGSLRKTLTELETSELYLNGDKIALIEQNHRQIEDIKTQVVQLERNLQSLRTSESNIQQLYSKYNEMKLKIDDMEKKEKEKELVSEENYKYITVEKEIKKKQSEVDNDKNKLEEIGKSIPEMIVSGKMSSDDTDREIMKLRSEENEQVSRIGSCRTEIARLNDEIKRLGIKIEELQDAGECPLCGQELTHEHRSRVMEEYRNQIEKSRLDIESNESMLGALTRKIDNIKKSIDSLSSNSVKTYYRIMENIARNEKDLNSMLIELSTMKESHTRYEEITSFLHDHESLRKEFKEIDNELQKLRGTVDLLKEQKIPENIEAMKKKIENLEQVDRANEKSFLLWKEGKRSQDFEQLRKRIADTRKEIESYAEKEDELKRAGTRLVSLNESIENMKKDTERLTDEIRKFGGVERELSEINARYSELMERKVYLTGQKSSLETSLKDLEKSTDKLRQELDEIGRIKKINDFLVLVKKAFNRDGIPQLIRQMALESINSITRNLISRFNLNIEDIRISDDLDVDIMQDGQIKNITQLSGGEKTSVSIAMRLAIAKYLGRNISTIMMDEPTIYLDEERRNDLREILQYAMKDLSDEGIFPQIVIITHHTELETAADISLHVSKVGGESVVENSAY